MFQSSKLVFNNVNIKSANKRFIHCKKKILQHFKNPIFQLSRQLGNTNKPLGISESPDQVDVVIIGGGAIGSSTAYWIKEKLGKTPLKVAVIERDVTYGKCSAVLSNGGLRQQFSLPENILLSLFSAKFLQNIKQKLGDDADVNLRLNGYLYLAKECQAEQLTANSKLQNKLGAKNEILTKQQIKEKFPYINIEGVELGCLGLDFEGWFDPWLYLQIMKKHAMQKRVLYINGTVTGFGFKSNDGDNQTPNEVVVKFSNGEFKNISFSKCVLAAGAESGKISKLLNIGIGPGILSTPLPVEPRKRFVFAFNCDKGAPPVGTPFVIDVDGTFHRRDGLSSKFIGGYSPKKGEEEPSIDNLEVDYDLFNNLVWPNLAHRVPAFEAIKLTSAWGGYYDFNHFDENGIIGKHPWYDNLYIATGFSGHGIMQSCAIGNAIAELLIYGGYKTIDLTRLGFERLIENRPMIESLII